MVKTLGGKFGIAAVILSFFILKGHSQFSFEPDTSIPVSIDGNQLDLPWAGGLNSGQYQVMDLNNDNRDDLVIFDRTSGKILTYINIENNRYEYDSDYEHFFPEDVSNWMVLADYDCDGKKDIFTNALLGMKIYRNVSDDLPAWEVVADPLFTQGSSSRINLQVNESDIPAINDLDGDGDLDILVFNFFAGGTIDHHLNRSMEKYGICDSLDFQRVDRNWGRFAECNCGDYAFGETCAEKNGSRAARVNHAGGKALLAFDNDGDEDKDILFGDEECTDLVYFENHGTADAALMLDFNDNYPNTQDRISFPFFPAGYYEDVNFDGVKDLIVAPNTADNLGDLINFKNSSWLYLNSGSDSNPQFTFAGNDFIQNESLDLGENAYPLFLDFDSDGDSDLILSSKGFTRGDDFFATLFLFENVGNVTAPSFALIDEDYLNFSSLKLKNLQLFLADYDLDNQPDIIYTGSAEGDNLTKDVFFLPNNATGQNAFSFDLNQAQKIAFSTSNKDNLFFIDIDGDRYLDILLGKPTGAIVYYRNNASNEFVVENETFFNIGNDIFKRTPSINAFDLNGDNRLELIITNGSGKINIYEDFLNNIDNPSAPFESVVVNKLKESTVASRFGRQSWTGFADLNNDRLPEMIVGNVQGGVQLLLNKSQKKTDGDNGSNLTLVVYPNPVTDEKTLKIESNQPAELTLFNVLGQKISDLGAVNTNQILPVDISTLPNGLYLLMAKNTSGKNTERLLIQK
ncbi:T9SS type A sorting domain-containing protein [Fulvivirgaceae bacterium BMA12]|uniref:T9SS type A sorting domain-containing protein n=1 Tax=Agaribacillus aureus TaxID=3051825 RepID=A0ABT8LHW0_9BACT|nr:T9SS type A sorting domain-containing protein [Fulvivirgaceae bacterium BMA12]